MDEKACDGGLAFQSFEPKAWDEDDIDGEWLVYGNTRVLPWLNPSSIHLVKVLYCGICGSDASNLDSEWGPVHPGAICGHEVVGEVVKVGSKVENGIKVGDIIGVGAQGDSCRECDNCKAGEL